MIMLETQMAGTNVPFQRLRVACSEFFVSRRLLGVCDLLQPSYQYCDSSSLSRNKGQCYRSASTDRGTIRCG